MYENFPFPHLFYDLALSDLKTSLYYGDFHMDVKVEVMIYETSWLHVSIMQLRQVSACGQSCVTYIPIYFFILEVISQEISDIISSIIAKVYNMY